MEPYFPEGSWYSPGYGVQLMVRRYVPGTAFALEYVSGKVARGCSDLSMTERRDRPDAVQALNAIYAWQACFPEGDMVSKYTLTCQVTTARSSKRSPFAELVGGGAGELQIDIFG
jgi:hypothetical protein